MHAIAAFLVLVVYTPQGDGRMDVTAPQSWQGPTVADYSACERQAFDLMMKTDAVAQCQLSWRK